VASSRWQLPLNFIVFQAAWFACIIAVARGRQSWGLGAIGIAVALHLALSPNWRRELKLAAVVTAIGLAWDSFVVYTGWLSYSAPGLLPWLAPLWIVAMWTLFATLLNVSLRWMQGRWVLAVLFGCFGGPLAYYGGAKLGALMLVRPAAALVTEASGWAILTPLLLLLASRLDE
jgi:hypothetical protein